MAIKSTSPDLKRVLDSAVRAQQFVIALAGRGSDIAAAADAVSGQADRLLEAAALAHIIGAPVATAGSVLKGAYPDQDLARAYVEVESAQRGLEAALVDVCMTVAKSGDRATANRLFETLTAGGFATSPYEVIRGEISRLVAASPRGTVVDLKTWVDKHDEDDEIRKRWDEVTHLLKDLHGLVRYRMRALIAKP